MNTQESKTLDIPELLSKSLRLYQENLKELLTMSLLISVVVQFLKIANNIVMLPTEKFGFMVPISGFFSMALSILGLYLTLRLAIAFKLKVLAILNNQSLSVRQSLINSNDYFWKVVGSNIIVGVIMFLPTALLTFGISSYFSVFIRVPMVLIGAAGSLYLGTKLFFCGLIRIIKPSKNAFLNYSVNLVNMDFRNALIIVAISSALLILGNIVQLAVPLITSHGMLLLLTDYIPMLLRFIYLPFQIILMVNTYFALGGEEERDELIAPIAENL